MADYIFLFLDFGDEVNDGIPDLLVGLLVQVAVVTPLHLLNSYVRNGVNSATNALD